MKIKNLSLVLAILTLSATSCVKDKVDKTDETATSFDDISVPASFTYATTQDVSVTISIDDPDTLSPYKYIVKIYDAEDGNLLSTGTVNTDTYTYTQSLKLPTSLTSVWAVVTLGGNVVSASSVSISGTSAITEIATRSMATKSVSIPSYSTDGYTEISGSNSINASNGAKYIVKAGTSFTGGINANGTLYLIVEGTASLSYFNMNGSLNLIIGSNGYMNSLSEIKSNYTVTNYSSSISVSTIAGTLTNYGTLNVSGLTINSGGTFNNYTTANISGSFQVNNNVNNYGTINVAGNMQINGAAAVVNSCQLIVSGNLGIDKTLTLNEGSYVNVTGTSTLNSSANVSLARNSYFKSVNIYNDSKFVGPTNGYAVVQYTSSKSGNSSTYTTNNIYLVDGNGNNTSGSAVNFAISSTDCNPGFGAVTDTDGDGIEDDEDAFPDDPDHAFVSYYPNSSTWGTLLFEDQWPSLGDYDFNDLVVKYQYEYLSNANNEVVDMVAYFQVMAVGANYSNGFGFTIDVPNNEVNSVTGNTSSGSSISLTREESSDGKTTIIVYSNLTNSFGNMVNVKKDGSGTTLTTSPIEVHINLTGVDVSSLTSINPFLYVSQTRGREIHLPGYEPTAKVNTSYFGQDDDASISGGTYYLSTDRYPWCLDIPQDIQYMIENKDFTTGYPDFISWAESGGATNTDWYKTNKNTSVLY